MFHVRGALTWNIGFVERFTLLMKGLILFLTKKYYNDIIGLYGGILIMYKNKRIGVIIPAAGQGRRMNSDVSKQYIEIDGKPIIVFTLEKFQELSWIDDIILVVGENEIDYAQKYIKNKYGFTKISKVILGGGDRQDSVYEGLKAMDEKNDIVLIHDGVRPMIDSDTIKKIIEETYKHKACVLGVNVKDTIKIIDEKGFVKETPNRNQLYAIQTPQAFERALILSAYKRGHDESFKATDDAMLIEQFTTIKVKIVEGSYSNFKITTPEDIRLFKDYNNNK